MNAAIDETTAHPAVSEIDSVKWLGLKIPQGQNFFDVLVPLATIAKFATMCKSMPHMPMQRTGKKIGHPHPSAYSLKE